MNTLTKQQNADLDVKKITREQYANMSVEDALQITATEILSRNARMSARKNNISKDNHSIPLISPKKLNFNASSTCDTHSTTELKKNNSDSQSLTILVLSSSTTPMSMNPEFDIKHNAKLVTINSSLLDALLRESIDIQSVESLRIMGNKLLVSPLSCKDNC